MILPPTGRCRIRCTRQEREKNRTKHRLMLSSLRLLTIPRSKPLGRIMAAVSYLYHDRPEREEKKVAKPKPSLALGR